MKLTFLGAAHEVTGSCALLTVNEKHILIDCGMEQGPDLYENQPLPIAAGDVDALLLTHAHIDHSGKIPLLCKEGFRGPIYCTSATANLCDIMLRDSAHIQEFEAEWRNRKALRAGLPEYVPLYTVQDAVNAMKQFSPCEYGEIISICDGVSVRFSDVGHLLGSATIEIWVQEEEETKNLRRIKNGAKVRILFALSNSCGEFLLIGSSYSEGRISLTISCMEVFPW